MSAQFSVTVESINDKVCKMRAVLAVVSVARDSENCIIRRVLNRSTGRIFILHGQLAKCAKTGRFVSYAVVHQS